MDDTNPSGSEPLNVNSAASAFLGLMGDDSGADEGQPAGEPVDENDDVVEASDEDSEVEYTDESDEDVEEAVDAEPEPQKFKVKAAGEEIEVDLNELISGYQRSKDYTQKSQALADQRKEIEAERAKVSEVQKEREVYAHRLQAIDRFLGQQMGNEVDLTTLKETDPIGYAVKVAERTELEKRRAVINAEQQRLAERQQAERNEQLQTHLQQESQLMTQAIPELAGEKGNSVKKEIMSYAKSIGFRDQELSAIYDHRAVLSLYKAMKYDALQKSKPEALKRVQSAPKTMKAGSSNPPTKSSQDKKVMQKLRQSGKVRDAATAFERFL
jgi:hypothetical protein